MLIIRFPRAHVIRKLKDLSDRTEIPRRTMRYATREEYDTLEHVLKPFGYTLETIRGKSTGTHERK